MTKLTAFIDGSAYAESVCDHTAWMAKQLSASVELVHVLGRRHDSQAPANLSGAIGLGARSALMEELAEADAQNARLAHKRGRLLLESAAERLRADGVTDVAMKLMNGDFVQAVEAIGEDSRALIIGKRGEGADFASGHLGSNLERAVRAARRPVFVAARAFSPIEKVLIAYDGGASAEKAVETVAESRVLAGTEVTVLAVAKEGDALAAKAAAAVNRLEASAVTPKLVIRAGHAEAVIEEVAAQEGTDLLVMGAYGHSRIRTLVIGSTTTAVLTACKIPVLLVR
ncbi:universal stress protein [Martelella endophytica]|uniref:Universal stress protein UspA n=1 Tax=Martelella endophytica TaxID=1486262 RepID=A0A0D5LUT5_MAREN|nr:universal stress protein [Martelella endophytica]AJY47512.1 universal stress protein UspA [Martelella endophytica]